MSGALNHDPDDREYNEQLAEWEEQLEDHDRALAERDRNEEKAPWKENDVQRYE